MAIILRGDKGSALTHNELDNNFRSFFYSASLSGTTLSFNETPANNDEIYVKYRYPNATNVRLVNNSVENQHLDLIYTSNQYTGDNTTTQYTIPTGHTVDSVLAIVDGLILQPTEYSISGATLTFTTAPSTSSTVDFRYFPI